VPDQREHKEAVHDAIQACSGSTPPLEGGVLTRWYVIAEFALPDSERGLVHMSGTADGTDLPSWDAESLLLRALVRSLKRTT
jgi:hypothetical protein